MTGKAIFDLGAFQARLAAENTEAESRLGKQAGATVSTKGKMFTTPDGESAPGPLDVIVIDWARAHSFFEGSYDPKNRASPVCWANGTIESEMAPSDKATKPQCGESGLCGISGQPGCCPKNEFESAVQGKGKACKNSYRLAIMPSNAGQEGGDDPEVWIINVSPGAMKLWDAYVRKVTALTKSEAAPGGLPVCVVKTEIKFNPNQTYPSLMFNCLGEHDNLETVAGVMDEAKTLLMREPG